MKDFFYKCKEDGLIYFSYNGEEVRAILTLPERKSDFFGWRFFHFDKQNGWTNITIKKKRKAVFAVFQEKARNAEFSWLFD